ncbi:hypothetical protein NC653_020066 [Populus alba x Populus x berolinensis]|uniref:Uncharacterized protein n=1 Tax=Populus alba x Populus x berolinensis TaxID=444605 RepID=A0AAD6MJY4_9ROSI|nr:hypothetical protein NC653_020061 [Populus alba x Populus x berolinensis]KAJ6986723.1 hypothetical protein NC653_020066 [Populus alba x Populus x berolinensis]
MSLKVIKKSENNEEFPAKKSQTTSRSDENAKNNNEETLYFGLNEVWTNKWKGGLRIHEAIVQERTAANYASASNTRSDESRGKEIAADDSTSTSEKPPIDSEVQEV